MVADSLYIFDVPTRFGDTFNMRTSTSGGCTVRVCRISEVGMEG